MAGKRGLRGRIPRAFADHRTAKGHAYRREYAAIVARFPGLPPAAERWVKEAALAAVELDLAAEAQEHATPRTAASLGHLRARLRQQLLDLEERLAALVPKPAAPTLEELIARAQGRRP